MKRQNAKTGLITIENGLIVSSIFRADLAEELNTSVDTLNFLITKLKLFVQDFRKSYQQRNKLSPYHCWAIRTLYSFLFHPGKRTIQRKKANLVLKEKSNWLGERTFDALRYLPGHTKQAA